MADDWEDAWEDDSFNPVLGVKNPTMPGTTAEAAANPWADEEEESSEDEKPLVQQPQPVNPAKAKQVAKAKRLARDAEERAAKAKAAAQATALLGAEVAATLTTGDAVSNPKMLQKKVEAQEVLMMHEMMGATSVSADATPAAPASDVIDSFDPKTKEEYNLMALMLKNKMTAISARPEYLPFLKKLFASVCTDLRGEEVKEVIKELSVISNEKLKAERERTKGKKKAVKHKAQARMGANDDLIGDIGGGSSGFGMDGGDEFDDGDFM